MRQLLKAGSSTCRRAVLLGLLTLACGTSFRSLAANTIQHAKHETKTDNAHLLLNLDGRIGEMRTLPMMQVADAHWGGNSSSEHEFVYEPPPGWIIYSYKLINESSFGDAWYTPQLTSANSHYIAKSNFESAMTDLENVADKYKNYQAKSDIEQIRKDSQHWSTMFQSANDILRVSWGGASWEKKSFGIVVDTDTASLHLGVVITIARTLSPTELNLLVSILKHRIARGQDIKQYFRTD